ncbi:MAG: hypothetical protein ABIP68_04905 [Ferruginibacter sp.]
MKAKKWTVQDKSDLVDINKEKRKWQIALRRYVIEGKPSVYYAPYFGLSVDLFREWIEIQFLPNLNWEGFGKEWQLEHLIPAQYFNFNNQEDLRLYWHFLNIRVENLDNNIGNRLDLLGAKKHFEELTIETGSHLAKKMAEKLSIIIESSKSHPQLINFLKNNKEIIINIEKLDSDHLLRLNQGEKLKDIILEIEILSKFGS